MIIAIDGPAGSGKGTVAKLVAKKLNFINIDTGAMYRCVALRMLQNNINLNNSPEIQKILNEIKIEFKDEKVILNGSDVSKEIRTIEVSNFVSPVSTIGFIREKMVELQRKLGEEKNVVMEGRDIGTVVFPNADLKIYLDATPEERARRRVKQNLNNCIISDFEQILNDIIERDIRDSTRKISPLKKADDAIVIDSTNLTIEEVVNKIIELTQI
ncbi:MAG: (d)CMP kinase [Clostridia bacterium]|nr:(d)CMP kinase [Clostridia bacterium]